MTKQPIKDHKDLGIYKIAFEAAMEIFVISKTFPVDNTVAKLRGVNGCRSIVNTTKRGELGKNLG